MKNLKNILVAVLLIICFIEKSYSRWWIFGLSKNDVTLQYVYINGISIDEIKGSVTIYKETLINGQLLIKGRAGIKNGKIASVRISLDGKETWEDAKLSEDGTFMYGFTPETSKTYKIYIEATDTTGKQNEVEKTFREVTISEQNIRSEIETVLRAMAKEYSTENDTGFMEYVSKNFNGDYMTLARAIRNDFSIFENIRLDFIINSVNIANKGAIIVSVNFNRTIVSSKTGQLFADKGMTEFRFKSEADGIKLTGMKNPLIFGLSDASNIATGNVISPVNDPIIVVYNDGTIDKKPLDEALNIINDGGIKVETSNGGGVSDDGGNSGGGSPADTVESGSNLSLVIDAPHPPVGFTFETGIVSKGSGDFLITSIVVSPYDAAWGWLDNGVEIKDLGITGINTISEAPASGYTNSPTGLYLELNHTYAFKLKDGKYGLLEVKSTIWSSQTMIFDYKYQTNGSRQFK